MDETEFSPDEPVRVPIDGELDLHTFSPRDVKDLIPEYVRACRAAGITEIRIVHGKGSGQLRELVHACLRKLTEVESFRLGGDGAGGWGATLVHLIPMNAANSDTQIEEDSGGQGSSGNSS